MFGKYETFQDCVDTNGDRDNPAGFCAFLHHRVTGQWPSENEEQVLASASVVTGRLEFSDEEVLPHLYAEEKETLRDVFGVSIFHAGMHRDSKGNEREWTPSQLNAMVKNFEGSVISEVPIKLGHTSPEHNAKIAKILGIPAPILLGEEGIGKGAARFGKVKRIFLGEEGRVRADFELHPKIESLVKDGFFSTISSEIIPDYRGNGPALSGVALLGADRPAVKTLDALTQSDFLNKVLRHADPEEGALLYFTELKDKLEFVDQTTAEAVYDVPVTETRRIGRSGPVQNRITTVRHVRARNENEARVKVKETIKAAALALGTKIAESLSNITIEIAAQDLYQGYAYGVRRRGGRPYSSRLFGRKRKGTKIGTRDQLTPKETVQYLMGAARRSKSSTTSGLGGKVIYAEGEEPLEFNLALVLAGIGAYRIGKSLYKTVLKRKQDKAGQPIPDGTMPTIVVNTWAGSPNQAKVLANQKMPGFQAQAAKLAGAKAAQQFKQMEESWYENLLEYQAMDDDERKKPPVNPLLVAGLVSSGAGAIGGAAKKIKEYRAKKQSEKVVSSGIAVPTTRADRAVPKAPLRKQALNLGRKGVAISKRKIQDPNTRRQVIRAGQSLARRR